MLFGKTAAETVTSLAFESVVMEALVPATRVIESFNAFKDLTTWLVAIWEEPIGPERPPLEAAYKANGPGVMLCRGASKVNSPPFVATSKASHLAAPEKTPEPKSNSTLKYPLLIATFVTVKVGPIRVPELAASKMENRRE
jgi:hypothetical protein